MKLDPTVMRTMNKQDFRVLAAVETGIEGRLACSGGTRYFHCESTPC
ncbi:hypothetical protein THAOC_25516, partial [Thalassiosira oceanica]